MSPEWVKRMLRFGAFLFLFTKQKTAVVTVQWMSKRAFCGALTILNSFSFSAL